MRYVKVTVLGTGVMGTGIVHSLLRADHEVTAYNRTPERAAVLAADGARVADTAAEAVTGADVVILTVFDADAVLAVMDEAGSASPDDAVWLQASTVGLEGTARIFERAERNSLTMLEAMLVGTKAPAEQGKLTVLMAGDQEYADRLAPVLEAISAKVVWVGAQPGAATALKLVVNAWIGSLTAATAQSLALAKGLGIDPELFLRTIEGSPTDSAYAHAKGAAMLAEDYTTSFAVDGVAKDLGLIVAAAYSAGVDSSLLRAMLARFEAASDAGHGSDDMAAVITTFTR